MRFFTVLLGAVFGIVSMSSLAVAQSEIFAGQWQTDWGLTEVFQDGAGFRGTYKAPDGDTDDDGTFVLSNDGKAWTGFWAESGSNERCDSRRFGTYYWGRLKLIGTFSAREFNMNWGYCDVAEPTRIWVFNIKTGGHSSPINEAISLEILSESPMADGRTVLHPGDEINVMFAAPADLGARSWIGFVADNATPSPEPEHFKQETIRNRTDGIMALGVPSKLGDYRLWMYDRANAIMLAEARVRIAVDMDSAGLEVPAGLQLAPGQSFTVNFDASPSYTFYTWVAVLDAGTPRDQKVASFPYGRFYLENRADGTLTFAAPTTPGRYLLRMHESYFKKTLTEVVLTVLDPNAPAQPAVPAETGAATDAALDAGANDTPTPPKQDPLSASAAETAPSQLSGNAQLAAIQQAVENLSVVQQPVPQVPASGNIVLDAALARYNHLYVTFGGEHRIIEENTTYSMPDEAVPSGDVIVSSETRKIVPYTGFFNFSTNLAAGYFANAPGRIGTGVNTDQDEGFGCYLQTGGLSWNGTIFSYSLNEGKLEAPDARKVYCRIEIVGVVAPDGSALQSLALYFQTSVSYLQPDTLARQDWTSINNNNISYTLQNLPIDLNETFGPDRPEDRTIKNLEYSDCLSFFGRADSAASFIDQLWVYQAFYGRFSDPPKFVRSEFERFYDSTRWTGDIERSSGRWAGDSVEPGIRVELCRS